MEILAHRPPSQHSLNITMIFPELHLQYKDCWVVNFWVWCVVNWDGYILQSRKGHFIVHAVNSTGHPLKGAKLFIKQTKRDIPIGCAIANTILNNSVYQVDLITEFTPFFAFYFISEAFNPSCLAEFFFSFKAIII